MEHSPAPTHRTRSWHARLGVLLTIPLLIVGLGLAQAGPVRGDPLDDALAEQKALAAQLAAQQKALNALIAQQGALTAQLASTSAALAKNTATLTSITTQVAQLSTAVSQAQVGLNKLNAAVNALDAEISRLVKAQQAKARDLAARQGILASRIREAYIADQTPPLWILLSGQSFTDILLDIAGFNALGAEDVKLADGISRDAARLAEIEDQVRANRAETEKLRVAAAKQKAALDKQVSLLNAAKARLAAAIAAQKKAIAAQKAAMDKCDRRQEEARRRRRRTQSRRGARHRNGECAPQGTVRIRPPDRLQGWLDVAGPAQRLRLREAGRRISTIHFAKVRLR